MTSPSFTRFPRVRCLTSITGGCRRTGARWFQTKHSAHSVRAWRRRDTTGISRPHYGLQPRVDWLALQSEHTEDALVNPPQRLLRHETFESLDTQRKLPGSKRPLRSHVAGA